MSLVKGWSMRSLPVLLENTLELLGAEIAVQIAVHHHGGRVVARPQADNRQQREAAVGSRLAELDPHVLGQLLANILVAHDPAAHAVADRDDVAADWLAKNQIVKSRDTIQVLYRHPEELGQILQAFV